jgi:hypothetical protein
MSVWLSGSDTQTLLIGQRLKLTLHNPAGSATTKVIKSFAFGSEVTFFIDSWIDPTGNLPTTVKPVNSTVWDGSAYTGDAVVKSGLMISSYTGGAKTAGGITVTDSMFIPFDIEVPPGHTFALQTDPQLVNTKVAASLSFIEV